MTQASGVPVDLHAVWGVLQKPLDLELSFRGAGNGRSQVEDCLLDWRQPIDAGTYQGECCAPEHAIHQKEIAEAIGVKSLDSPSFYDAAHSNAPALFGATAAQGKTCTLEQGSSSKFDSAPHSYGVSLFHSGNNATGARA
jgi:hypothetical protein